MQTATPFVQVGAVALASFTVGERSVDRIRGGLVTLLVAAMISLALIAQDADAIEALVFPFIVLVPAWLLGDIVRQRRLDAIARAEANERALREAEERLRAAVAEERRTMARELHDVVAHGVSVMLIQAGAARQVVDESPERATEALLTVEATGREAMSELRRLLGVLDDGGGEGAGLAPQPGRRPDRRARSTGCARPGCRPSSRSPATPRPLPPSLDVTVYRIVQEALTNALRYARRAATLVRLTWEPAQLRIEILDDGPTEAADGGDGSGRGLVGMRERAIAGRRPARGRAAARRRLRRPGVAAHRDGAVVTAARAGSVRPRSPAPGPHRRRPGARPRRVPDDPRGPARHPGRGRGGATARPRSASRAGTAPDVVLMDVRMPGLDGLEATRRLLDGGQPRRTAPRVIVLTTFDLDEYVYAALQAGASGFLLKDVSPEQLVAAVRTVAVGDALLAPAITRRLVERYARPSQTPAGDAAALATLTPASARSSACSRAA